MPLGHNEASNQILQAIPSTEEPERAPGLLLGE